jgi:hypothetical protein
MGNPGRSDEHRDQEVLMIRATAGVVSGFIVGFAISIGLFMAMWFGLGPDAILEKGLFKGNMILNIGAPLFTVIGGLVGGWLCARVSRSRRAVIACAAVLFLVGAWGAYDVLQKPEPGPRAPGLTAKQALDKGREPTWFALINPLLGAGSILVGGMCLCRCGCFRKTS